MSDPSGARRALHSLAALSLALALACHAYEPRPLELDDLAAGVRARGATSADVARALELADLRALPFEPPALDPAVEPDADRGAFWHASALAYNGELRAARRRFAEASALSRSAGAPSSAELEVEQAGFESGERETWIALTFDVLGLFDAGRARAARALAVTEARTAFADVEGAAWAARIAVDRARTELGDSLAKSAELARLLEDERASLERARLLHQRGRLSDGEEARLAGMVAEVAHELHMQHVHVAWHRRALADAAGLPPRTPALARATGATVDDLFAQASFRALPGARELMDRSPPLRRARLEYAVAEAVLRDEVARTRPGLRLGPALALSSDDALPGGVLVLDLPHARALSGRVEAARERRERAREELEEALRAALAQIEQARASFDAARDALAEHAEPRVADAERRLAAERARFAVEPGAVEGYGMALRETAMARLDLAEVRHEVVLAWLDLEEALGPEARPLPGDEALASSPPKANPSEEARP